MELDELIAIITAAQEKDGYLNTPYQLPFENPASPGNDNPHVKRYGYGPEQMWKAILAERSKGMGYLTCLPLSSAVAFHQKKRLQKIKFYIIAY